MRRVVALLAAAALSLAPIACGDDGGAEPGASSEATLVLDFTPNAVHSGIYAALADGEYDRQGIALEVREPSASTDAPKLLEAGRADFAILDIHDLAIARERGFDIVGIAAIVQRPLAAVIARDRDAVRTPADLEGRTVGVTGLPSDDAVLDSVVSADGGDANQVHRVTIGFNAVASLAAGRIDAATAFWNAEGVTLQRQGVPIRVFRVDDYGAPRYPELVLVTTSKTLNDDPDLVHEVVDATARGYSLASSDPGQGLDDLLAADPSLDRADQAAELRALESADAFRDPGKFDWPVLRKWAQWEAQHGIVKEPPAVSGTFAEVK